ncbi:entericidin A/B family lipoprotein [Massilia sp. Root351]|jgi:predicted small secreted protein|nr:entericidin A/B family lipoprotein [Massilia sp. Root351]
MKTLSALAAAAIVATIVLTGCNTISGIGRDVQKVGQVVTGAGGK